MYRIKTGRFNYRMPETIEELRLGRALRLREAVAHNSSHTANDRGTVADNKAVADNRGEVATDRTDSETVAIDRADSTDYNAAANKSSNRITVESAYHKAAADNRTDSADSAAVEEKKEEQKREQEAEQAEQSRNRKIAAALLGCSVERLDGTDPAEVKLLVEQYALPLLQSALCFDQRYRSVDRFEACGVEWLLPDEGSDVSGGAVPLCNIDAITFCEASDLATYDPLGCGGLIAAKLCRSAGATDAVLDPMQVPVSAVQAVVARLRGAHSYMATEFAHCYADRSEGDSGGGETKWCDFLRLCSDLRPSEVVVAEKMNCYDFMALANVKTACRKKRTTQAI